ncbi:MAG TPA: single-stranded DNA-binding protein [Acidimicrobiales bacterium]|jgi:single-strand DNA-binding protein|nr:single-stranded DNA-binding protein [Acidimicrobiales bacterium]
MTNVVVLVGRLARPAQLRHLPSGDFLVEYQVTVPRTGQRADSVPVVWERAPASASSLDAGDEVVVVGRVRRRFFRAGGGTASRTEVVAESVVPSRLAKRARASVAAALARIQQAAEPRASRASG